MAGCVRVGHKADWALVALFTPGDGKGFLYHVLHIATRCTWVEGWVMPAACGIELVLCATELMPTEETLREAVDSVPGLPHMKT